MTTHLGLRLPRKRGHYADVIVAMMLGDFPCWQESWNSADFIDECAFHGVGGWVHQMSQRANACLPEPVCAALEAAYNQQRVFEQLHGPEMGRVLEVLAAADVEALVLKGTALAYSVYPQPWLRARSDTDILICEHSRVRVEQLLSECDYQVDWGARGTYQASYARRDSLGCWHVIDVHWRIANRELFAQNFAWLELRDSAIEISLPGASAGALAPEYQMIHACLHRAVHLARSPYRVAQDELVGDRLIWLADVFLLGRSLDAAAWHRVCDIAAEKQLVSLLADGVAACRELFPLELDEQVLSRLQSADPHEASRRLLHGSKLVLLWEDFRAAGWADAPRLLRGLLFPPAGQMLTHYGKVSLFWLPALYLHRVIRRTMLYFSPG